MQRVLKKKYNTPNDLFTTVYNDVWSYVTPDEVTEYADRTRAEVEQTLKHLAPANPAIGWSGGKDSVILGHLLHGIVDRGACSVSEEVHFPAWVAWCEANKPDGVEIIRRDFPTFAFLQANRKYLFPADNADYNWWAARGQRVGQKEYAQRYDVDLYIYGRRKSDNNYTGVDGVMPASGNGPAVYSPLRDWPQEIAMGYLRLHNLDIPPTYFYPQGWLVGSDPWPARYYAPTPTECFRILWDADPSVVQAAAVYFLEANDVVAEMAALS